MKKLIFIPASVAILAGCATSPPEQFGNFPLELPATYAAVEERPVLHELEWLQDFSQPELAQLVDEALRYNLNLRAALARLESVRENIAATGADRLPQISASFVATTSQRAGTEGFSLASPRTDRFDLGGSLLWELDLWDRLRDQTQAAIAEFEAVEEDYRGLRLSLAATALRLWFQAAEAVLQAELARETLQTFEQHLEVVEGGFRRGLNTALEVSLTRANVASARSQLELRQSQRDARARALETLLGRYPADRIELGADLPTITQAVPAGLPSELLRRRPDIAAAERRVAAAHERRQAARKNLLPAISLTAGGGTSSTELRDLLDPEQVVWNFAGNLVQPLFQGGRLRARSRAAAAQFEEEIWIFGQTALEAFQEVETALAAEQFLAGQEEALSIAAEESQIAEDLAWEEFQRGLADIITLLESQRRAFTARSSLLQARNLRLQNRLDLYLALGGDFTRLAPSGFDHNGTP